MPQEGQTTVTLKSELVDEIKAAIEQEKPMPSSVAGFVTVAVEEKLTRLKGVKK